MKYLIPTRVRRVIRRAITPVQPMELEWHLRTDLNIKIRSHSDWVIYNDIFVDQEYDVAIDSVLSTRPADRPLKILDLGANVGFFTLRFIDLLRRNGHKPETYSVVLVEGSQKMSNELHTRLLQENQLGQNCQIVHGLVGLREGRAKILEGDFSAMNSVQKSAEEGILVNYVDLFQILGEAPRIDLLKCDIEGSEQVFLENYSKLLPCIRYAVFEFHPKLCDTSKCYTLLQDSGFVHSRVLRATEDFEVVYFSR